MIEHPSPMSSNDRDIGDAFYHKGDIDMYEYIFGFHSLEQLYRWFSSDKEIEYLKRYNFSISVYDAEDIETSQYQAIANKNSLKLINKLTIN